MGKVILVTGGSRSGKSLFAEELAKKIGCNIMYMATAIPFDDEMKDRIKKHKMHRPRSWFTYEGYKNLFEIVEDMGDQYPGIILDCVTVMITNLMFSYDKFDENNIEQVICDEIEEEIKGECIKLVNAAKEKDTTLIMVTNELGSGVVPESKLGRAFRDIAGRINQTIAKEAEDVYLLVSGIPLKIK